MKLHEALAERSGNQKKESLIGHRLDAAARHQEDEDPPESADELIVQLRDLLDDQARLIAAINHTNAATRLDPADPASMTITQALARRDMLNAMHKRLTSAEQAASGSGRHGYGYRVSRSEIRDVTEMNVAGLRHDLDGLSREIRTVDAQIQAAGLTTDLIELA